MSIKPLVFILVVGFASTLRLYSAGTNSNGQAGDGTAQYTSIPQNISSKSILSNIYVSKLFVGVSANHVLASDGSLYAWVCLNKILIT
jgi:alpha-tubulin suppressor-like RCC1 family protein